MEKSTIGIVIEMLGNVLEILEELPAIIIHICYYCM